MATLVCLYMTRKQKASSSDEGTDGGRKLGRRSYLQCAAATATAALGAGAFAGTGAADKGFETIVIPEGVEERIWITDELFENKLIDITADGAGIHFIGHGDATFRNIGIKGEQPSDWGFGHNWMVLQADEGSTVRAENVYMADGLEDDYGGGGIFVHRNHAGHCIIDNVHVANSGDNGIYASSPGQETAGRGTVEIRNSLSRNNTVSQFRIGSAGSEIYNCVAYVDELTPQYRNPGASRFSRGIWHWYRGDCEVHDVDIDMGHDPRGDPAVWAGRDGGHLHLRDSDIVGTIELDPTIPEEERGELTTKNLGDKPILRPPKGVPMSAEAAAKRRTRPPGPPEET